MSTSSADIFDALKPGDHLLEYRIEKVLGHGGFGITYLAHDTLLDAPYAIKEFLPPELAARDRDNSVTLRSEATRKPFDWAREKFLNEARVLARFAHPNLVRVNRFFEANGTVYFVMDYVDGQPLSDWLKAGGSVDQKLLESILLPLADGLVAVHAEGVLHRDIKPGNIILRPDGSPVLIDFGAARQAYGSVTRSMLNVVTAGYAPIEQYSEGMAQGPWTDIYALAAVAYRMIAGRKPPDAVERLRNDPMILAVALAIDHLPTEMLRAVDWGLAVHPEDRPKDLETWRAALLGEQPVPEAASVAAERTEILPPPRRADTSDPEATEIHGMPDAAAAEASPRQRKAWTRGIAAAVLLVVATVLWVLRPIASPEPVDKAEDPPQTESVAQAEGQDNPDHLESIRAAEQQLAQGNTAAVATQVMQRLSADKQDVVALVLRGHLAFEQGQRAKGIADYAQALAINPRLARNERLAENLVGALGWETTAAEGVIKAYASEAIYQQLVDRTEQPGPIGRGHAHRILHELGEDERIDQLAFARMELTDRVECDARIAAIKTIRKLGDASWIPLLKEQIPNWLTNLCLRGAINRAVDRLEERPANG